MANSIQLIQWPAVIKLKADDELIFVLDATQFTSDETLWHLHTQPEDILIDSAGAVYRFNRKQTPEIFKTELVLSLSEVLELLRRHLSNHGTCCVAKFHANSISEAIISVFTGYVVKY